MKKVVPVLQLLLLPAMLYAQPPQSSQPKPLVFTHVTVIDATGTPARPDMTVLITGDRITQIGKNLHLPKDAQVVNARKQFLIPGLWDMHVHTATKDFLSLYVANGITGVRDMFSPLTQINQWRKQISEGTLIGPRIVAAGAIIDGPEPVWPGSFAVSNEAEGRKAVKAVKDGGSDFVKVYSLLPRDAYFAIADEAKKQGIPFAGHVPNSVTVAEASDAGQKSIEHLIGVSFACSSAEAQLMKELKERISVDRAPGFLTLVRLQAKSVDTYDSEKARALFSRLVKNGTWQVPTLTVLRANAFLDDPQFTDDLRVKYLPPSLRQAWNPQNNPFFKLSTAKDYANLKKLYRKELEIVGEMQRAGVGILAGTDTPNPYVLPGFSLHDELALVVQAGLTPMEALQSATLNPARFLGMEKEMGTVQQGKVADLVLLEANPLEDIHNTQKINSVVVKGRLLDRKALDGLLAKAEAEANKK